MTQSNSLRKLMTGAGAAAVLAGSLTAGDPGKTVINDKMPIESSFCDIFKKNTLYEGDGFIKKVKLKGRYHGQFISQSEDINGVYNNSYNEYDHRRFRLGLEIEMAHDLTLVASNNIADGTGGFGATVGHGLTTGTFFDDWDELNLAWEPSDDFYVIVGKQKQKITRENTTSSNSILTIERAPITNSVISNKPWGVAVGFKALGLSHEVGAWVAGGDRDVNGERWDYADFDSRESFTYRTSYDLAESTTLFFDYQYTDNSGGFINPGTGVIGGGGGAGPLGDTNLGSIFEHVAAVGTESEWGQFGLITDFIYASNGLTGGGLPVGYDTFGVVIMPYYNLTEKLQFVTRYSYMEEGREQRTQRFGPNAANRQTVEDYHTFYAGLNYYVCKHNLKIMGGYEYATGTQFGAVPNDIDTGTWMLAVRTSW